MFTFDSTTQSFKQSKKYFRQECNFYAGRMSYSTSIRVKTSVLVLNVRRTVDLCIISQSTERRLTLCIDVEGDYFIHRLLCQFHLTMMTDPC